MPIMQVFLLEGRTDDQKAALIAELTKAAVRTVDVKEESVRVIITDMPGQNFGIAGQSAKKLKR